MSSVLAEGAEKGWRNFDELAAGIGTNRVPNTQDWLGKELKVDLENNQVLELSFNHETVNWSYNGESGEDPYEEVRLDTHLYFIDINLVSKKTESLTLVLNADSGRVITVRSEIHDDVQEDESTRLTQEFLVGNILGVEVKGEVPGPTRELLGYRTLSVYSDNHTYEHFYVNSNRYAWQCLNGVQKGHGDMDYATYYKLEDNVYVFCFREKIIPVATVLVLDFNNGTNTGKFFGINSKDEVENSTSGAKIEKTSFNCYPVGVEPV